MMTCEEAVLLLSARMDSQLTQEDQTALEDHLAQCPECRAIAAQLEETSAAMAELADLPAPEGFAQRVMDNLGEQERPAKVVPLFRRPQFKALAGLAACAVLCVGLYSTFHHQNTDPVVTPATMNITPGPNTGGRTADVQPEINSQLVSPTEGQNKNSTDAPELDTRYNAVSRSVSGLVALQIPEGWQSETITEEERVGLRFWPDGHEGAVVLYCCTSPMGVCGTGLEEEQIQLPSGSTWTKGTYDGHKVWDFLYPSDKVDTFMAVTEPGVAEWWEEFGDEAMTILDSAVLEQNER